MSSITFRFNDLPDDVKTVVVDQVLLPSHLKSLCLVNKGFHALAVKPLYNSIALEIGSKSDTRITALLHPRNIGLPHVRHVRLSIVSSRHKTDLPRGTLQQAHLVTRMLLEFMPRDVLKTLFWAPVHPFSADNLCLLLKQQRKLELLQVLRFDGALPFLRDRNPTNVLDTVVPPCITDLVLCLDNLDVLRNAASFLDILSEKLEHLAVESKFLESRSSSPDSDAPPGRQLQDSATEPGLLTRTLFDCKHPFGSCKPLPKLKSLHLSGINLRHCADTWCKVIDFTKIETLHISNCGGGDALLSQLSKALCIPQNLTDLTFQHTDNDENEALLALENLLCHISGLEKLTIDLDRVSSLPEVVNIKHHGKTLRVLNVHASPASRPRSDTGRIRDSGDMVQEHCWSAEDFKRICISCKKLEQLSTAWPAADLLGNSPSNEPWNNFECHLRRLKHLVTLHISTWPTASHHFNSLTTFDTLMQSFAQRLFEISVGGIIPVEPPASPPAWMFPDIMLFATPAPPAPPSSNPKKHKRTALHLIAFGVADHASPREDPHNQLIYLRSTRQSSLDAPEVYAAPVGRCLRRFVEPRSRVLDFPLLKPAPLPFQDGPASYVDARSPFGGGAVVPMTVPHHPPPPPFAVAMDLGEESASEVDF